MLTWLCIATFAISAAPVESVDEEKAESKTSDEQVAESPREAESQDSEEGAQDSSESDPETDTAPSDEEGGSEATDQPDSAGSIEPTSPTEAAASDTPKEIPQDLPPMSTPEAPAKSEATSPNAVTEPSPTTPLGPSRTIVADVRLSLIAAHPNLQMDEDDDYDDESLGFFGADPVRLFFEDHERLDLAYRNAAHALVVMSVPEGPLGIDTEIAAAVLLNYGRRRGGIYLADGSSYLKLSRDLGFGRVILTGFPLDADRIRLGYSRGISWGGSSAMRSQFSPGARLSVVGEDAYGFVAGKGGVGDIVEPDGNIDLATLWGVIGGTGWRGLPYIQVDLMGGYFYRGVLDRAELMTRDGGEPWVMYGGAARIAHSLTERVPMPVDFRVLDNDPFVTDSFFLESEDERSFFAYTIDAELNLVFQPLQDTDDPRETAVQTGIGADVSARFRLGDTRFGGLFVFRDVPFIHKDVPSFWPYANIPDFIAQGPEWAGSIFVEHDFAGLVPSIRGGLRRPAFAEDNRPLIPAQPIVYVFDGASSFVVLDEGSVEMVVEVKAGLLWRISEWIGGAAEVMWLRNPNWGRVSGDPSGNATLIRETREEIALTLVLRGRLP